jgi:hypothetical protein
LFKTFFGREKRRKRDEKAPSRQHLASIQGRQAAAGKRAQTACAFFHQRVL